ncbi:hypothetical protein Tco_0841953 [Tanacetum coccineum]|uniref:Uncharacterized protein n=1 Tax=Tanacetum coccineum TaxID=301880 RepID=A0ABQ5AXV1_9ASTR
MVITPSGHNAFPAKPIRGDVSDQIEPLPRRIAAGNNALMMRGYSPLQCFGIGSSLENAILVLVGSVSGAGILVAVLDLGALREAYRAAWYLSTSSERLLQSNPKGLTSMVL